TPPTCHSPAFAILDATFDRETLRRVGRQRIQSPRVTTIHDIGCSPRPVFDRPLTITTMSGLEPIAALGLACSILQVLEQAMKTTHVAIKVYKGGTLDDLKGHKQDAETLRSLSAGIETICNSKPTLEELLKDLRKVEDQMRTGLLAATFEAVHAADVQLTNVKDDLRNFFIKYENGERDIARLVSNVSDTVSYEASKTRAHTTKETDKASKDISRHVTSEMTRNQKLLAKQIGTGTSKVLHGISSLKDESAQTAVRERLLASLQFDRMNERWSHVRGAEHPKTLDWIMKTEQPKGSLVSWDVFPHWLQSSEPIYWISGKPGAGKSTLISYILTNDETTTNLKIWRDNVIILRHFFWRPGTPMQQSSEGLLCSLAHQILESDSHTLDLMMQSSSYARKKSHTDWSRSELRSLCLELLGSSTASFCVFLDGIDELDPSEHFYDLWELIRDMQTAASNRLKFCLSSRPEPDIRIQLGRLPGLKVQDVNRQDLVKFVTDQLEERLFAYLDQGHKHPTLESSDCLECSERHGSKEYLKETLVDYAEGVFLWLRLAVRRVKQSLTNRRTIEEIRQEIEFMPDKIEECTGRCGRSLPNTNEILDRRVQLFTLGYHNQHYFLNLLLVALGSTDHKLHLTICEDKLIDRLASLVRTCKFIEENIDNDSLGFIDTRVSEETSLLVGTGREGTENLAVRPIKLVWEKATHEGCKELLRYANDHMAFRFVHRITNLYYYVNGTNPSDARAEVLSALASKFEDWTARIILLRWGPVRINESRFYEDTFAMVTPLSLTLANVVNAYYRETYGRPHPGVGRKSKPIWSHLLDCFQFYLDRGCLVSEEILLWIGQPFNSSAIHNQQLPTRGIFLASYNHPHDRVEYRYTTTICVLSFPIALALRYILEALRCWEPLSWIKDLPSFSSLEKVAMYQDGIKSQHDTTEALVQPLIVVTKRICELHRLGELDASYATEEFTKNTFTEVKNPADQVILRDIISGFVKNPRGFLDKARHQQLINHLAEAHGRCEEAPMKLDEHLIRAGYLRVGLAGLD
ncbi:hypothetical protein PspLS_11282, partial [Pyricularia sp. CBS 133598]